MSAIVLPPRPAARPSGLQALRRVAGELLARERRLALYGALLLALLLPMAIAWGADDRVLRGVSVWIKPMKFALSIAVLALTTAWFAGHLPAQRRASRAMDWIVWLLIGAGSFELGYITLQAALGQGSHYNVGDLLHGVMYSLMGIGALALTATQPMLAWQLYRHADASRPTVVHQAVQLGLVLTFVFGAGAGMVLSTMQPPEVAQLPLLGWSMAGGDLRPAHFVGIHAEQALPLVAFAVAGLGARRARVVLVAASTVYSALFVALFAWGLSGRL